jgi:hypothetical protein
MDRMKTPKHLTSQPDKSMFLFHNYGAKRHDTKTAHTQDEIREMGRIMGQKVAKKLKLNLDI